MEGHGDPHRSNKYYGEYDSFGANTSALFEEGAVRCDALDTLATFSLFLN